MPRPSVFAFFLCPKRGEILLVHQRQGKWALPGGRCSASERTFAALRREVLEETGHRIPVDARPERVWRVCRRWRRRAREAIVFLFLSRPTVLAAAEVDAVRWFSLDALPQPISRTAIAAARECLRRSRLALRMA